MICAQVGIMINQVLPVATAQIKLESQTFIGPRPILF